MNRTITATLAAAALTLVGLSTSAHAGDDHHHPTTTTSTTTAPPSTDPPPTLPPPVEPDIEIRTDCDGTFTVLVTTGIDTPLPVIVTIALNVTEHYVAHDAILEIGYHPATSPTPWSVSVPVLQYSIGGTIPGCPAPTTTETPTTDAQTSTSIPAPTTTSCVSVTSGATLPCDEIPCEAAAPACTTTTAPPPPTVPVTVPPATAPSSTFPPTLPATGAGGTALIAAVGAALIIAGGLAVRRTRKETTTP